MLIFYDCLFHIKAARKHLCHVMAIRKQSDNGSLLVLEVNNIRVMIYASPATAFTAMSSIVGSKSFYIMYLFI